MTPTLKQLQAMCITSAGRERAAAFVEPLSRHLPAYGIVTPTEAVDFLAQCLHESAEFRYLEEIASGKAYEGRVDLGNTQPGDGVRFKGRGLIQITGRTNYGACGKAIGADLLEHPEQLATTDLGTASACWFWQTHGLNRYADAGDFITETRRINGGINGLGDRQAYRARVAHAMGVAT